jgi:hypothetical protein
MTEYAGQQIQHSQMLVYANFAAQAFGEQAEAEAARERRRAAAERVRWSGDDAGFQRRRVIISEDLAAAKARLVARPGGVLNYPERMRTIQQRFDLDFSEAASRAVVASRGLKDYFGFDMPVPSSVRTLIDKDLTTQVADADYVDELLLWVRTAISSMIRFRQLDQGHVHTVSLRSLVTEDAWRRALASTPVRFRVTEEHFPNQRNVRLRGISAALVGDSSQLWRMTARVPAMASVHHVSGSGETVTVDQAAAPTARLGRVGVRSGSVLPDTTGGISLHNLSPIGEWTLTMAPIATVRGSLSDVQLDLHVDVRDAINS